MQYTIQVKHLSKINKENSFILIQYTVPFFVDQNASDCQFRKTWLKSLYPLGILDSSRSHPENKYTVH